MSSGRSSLPFLRAAIIEQPLQTTQMVQSLFCVIKLLGKLPARPLEQQQRRSQLDLRINYPELRVQQLLSIGGLAYCALVTPHLDRSRRRPPCLLQRDNRSEEHTSE